MKAAIFYGKHDLRVQERPVPAPAADGVLLRVGACGICGTDLHIFNGDEGAAATPPGTVLGHEFAGEIVQCGRDVTAFSPGDRVCVDPNKLCGSCDFCRAGKGHFCESVTGIGTTVDGGFAEYCAVPASQLFRVPDHVPFTCAAFSEPTACCLHGMDLCDFKQGDTVAVIGGGPIGLIMLQLAALRGAGKLILIEPVREKRELARRLGADVCVDPAAGDLQSQLSALRVGNISCVIECVGKPQTMEQAVDIAGKYSTVMLFGLTRPQDEIKIKPFQIFKKEITLRASFINPYTQQRAVDLIAGGKLDVEPLVNRTASLDELPALLADPSAFRGGKIVIIP